MRIRTYRHTPLRGANNFNHERLNRQKLVSDFAGGTLMKSQFVGKCWVCKKRISKGSSIYYDGRARHEFCYEDWAV